MAGSAVVMMVPSRFSMNNAQATISATIMGRETRENIEIGPCAKIWGATKRLGGA